MTEAQVERLIQAVDAKTAHAVLWHFAPAPGVMEPGSFIQALVAAIAAADPRNRLKLGMGFPSHVCAVELAQGVDGGIERLRQVAGIAEAREPFDSAEVPRCSRGYTEPEHWIDGYYSCPGFGRR